MRAVVLPLSVILWVGLTIVGPVVAQDDEPDVDATPVPTSIPVASPPALAPSSSPAAVVGSSLPTPPAVTGGVFADPLAQATVFAAGACQTGVSGGKYVGGGFALIVGGPCVDDAPVADVAVPARGITLWDGDIAFDFRMAVHGERARFALYVRSSNGKLLVLRVHPGLQGMTLATREDDVETTLVSRDALDITADPDTWNRLALRVRGDEAWVLVNDEAVLYAANVLDQAGNVGLQLVREGSLDDDEEVGVVFKDLTLSTVADSDPSRAPTHRAP
jgi:hypothetical protein